MDFINNVFDLVYQLPTILNNSLMESLKVFIYKLPERLGGFESKTNGDICTQDIKMTTEHFNTIAWNTTCLAKIDKRIDGYAHLLFSIAYLVLFLITIFVYSPIVVELMRSLPLKGISSLYWFCCLKKNEELKKITTNNKRSKTVDKNKALLSFYEVMFALYKSGVIKNDERGTVNELFENIECIMTAENEPLCN